MKAAVESDVLTSSRAEALRKFEQLGWPTTRLEAWKYTNLAAVSRIDWKSADSTPAFAGHPASLAGQAAIELVFINGRLAGTSGSAAGAVVTSLADPASQEKIEAALGKIAVADDQAMTALNLAHTRDGAFIEIREGAIIKGFIHLLFIGDGSGEGDADGTTWSHPRNVVVAGRNSQVTIVESYVGSGRYFTNTVTELDVRDGAVVDHCKIECESLEAFHVGSLQIHEARSSSVTSSSVALGGSLVRNEIGAILGGEGANLVLDGLFVVKGTQHVDNHTVIDHAMPHCDSQELYKGILDDNARGIFDGTIIVRKDAQKTVSRQVNKNLLLSESAIVDSKPTLEIHADDVKCNHGSTIGQLDDEAMFYLRARGIGEDEARQLLVHAFASELVDRIRVEPVREAVRRSLFAHMPSRLPERRETSR